MTNLIFLANLVLNYSHDRYSDLSYNNDNKFAD